MATIEGVITPSANGTLQLQAGVNGALGTAIIRRGTSGLLWLLN